MTTTKLNMEVDLKELLELQEKLDSVIEGKLSSEVSRGKIMSRKVLAFIVELCELANETRCFKYWSQKSSSANEVIFEEYADGLHFLLSLGMKKTWETTKFFIKVDKVNDKQKLVNKFNELVNISTSYFNSLESDVLYFAMLQIYLELGLMLGMSGEDIKNSYKNKNQINHERQNSGY